MRQSTTFCKIKAIVKQRGQEVVLLSFELKGKRARTQVHPLTKIMHRVPTQGLHAEMGPLKVQKKAHPGRTAFMITVPPVHC